MKARDAKGPSSDGADDGLPLLPVVAPPLLAPHGDAGHRVDVDTAEGLIPEVAPTLRAGGNKTGGDRPPGTDVDTVDTLVPIAFHATQDPDVSGDVTHPLGQNYGQEASVAIPFDTTQITHPENRSNPQPGDPMGTLAKGGHAPAIAYGIRSDAQREGDAKTLSADAEGKMRLRPPGMGISEGVLPTIDASQPHAVAYDMRGREGGAQFEGPHDTANLRAADGGSSRSYVQQRWAVRRITPIEGERLQGFPDGYTQVPYRKKPAADGPRYKGLGNSWATNVAEVIGERIAMVEADPRYAAGA